MCSCAYGVNLAVVCAAVNPSSDNFPKSSVPSSSFATVFLPIIAAEDRPAEDETPEEELLIAGNEEAGSAEECEEIPRAVFRRTREPSPA